MMVTIRCASSTCKFQSLTLNCEIIMFTNLNETMFYGKLIGNNFKKLLIIEWILILNNKYEN